MSERGFPEGDFFGSGDGEGGELISPEEMIDEALLLSAEGDFESAFHMARMAAAGVEEEQGDPDSAVTALDLAAYCAIEGGADGDAEEMIRELRNRNRAADADLNEARLRFYQWNLDAASRLIGLVPPGGGRAGEIAFFKGILAEFAGRQAEAEALLAEAVREDPQSFSPPYRFSDEELDEVVSETLGQLPEEFRAGLENVVIEVVELPDPVKDARDELHPLMLGVFEGPGLGDESVFDPGGLPPRIRVFRKNLERIVTSKGEAVDELARTLYHEIGHRLGFDEEGLEGLDLD